MPTKADIKRLKKIADEWLREEKSLDVLFGPAVKGSVRSRRVKDLAALVRVIEYATKGGDNNVK